MQKMREAGHQAQPSNHHYAPLIASFAACLLFAQSYPANSQTGAACLITKSDASQFSAELQNGAVAKAQELRVGLDVTSVGYDINVQISAIQNCVSRGVRGILIEPADPAAIVPAVRMARDAGILVITLGTELNPPDAADVAIVTDQVAMGEVAAIWARANLGTRGDVAALLVDDNLPRTADGSAADGFFQAFPVHVDDASALPIFESWQTVTGVQAFKADDLDSALERVQSNNMNVGAILTSGNRFEERWDELVERGVQGSVPLIAFGGGCSQLQYLAPEAQAAIVIELPDQMAATGIEAIAEFMSTGAKLAPTEGRRFVAAPAALVLSNSQVQMPSPICQINPRFCNLRVLSADEALQICR